MTEENLPSMPPKQEGDSISWDSASGSGKVTVTSFEGRHFRVNYKMHPERNALIFEVHPGVFNLQVIATNINEPTWKNLDWETIASTL